ncbi:MAG: hypothetical protein PHW31_02300 [Candidatus Pacebacteria bacterium]|nr:hypothetical protein [Candidatus Paceibacterota bacterium]
MKIKISIGILLFCLSYLQIILPKPWTNFWSLSFFYVLFALGIILICESITNKLAKESLLNNIIHNKKTLFRFILVSAIGGLGLDGIAQWLGKLWFYPYYSLFIYSISFVGGFALYWLVIAESYLAVKLIINFLRKGKKTVTKYFKFEAVFFKAIGIIGAFLIPLAVFLILREYTIQGGYIFSISPIIYKANFWYIMLSFFGIWFLLEFAEYAQRKTSLLKNIFHRNFIPLLSIVIASFALSITMEAQNIIHGYWVYLNWPIENIKLLGLPLFMILAWPFHYIAFLSLFRAATGAMSDEIWSGDKIK